MTEYYIQEGFILKHRKNDKTYGLFSLNKFIKKIAKVFHISFVDDCCEADTTSLPVRYNQDDSQLEFYNPTTKTWDAVS